MNTQIDPQRNFTTTLPDSFLQKLTRDAKELQMQKKDLLMHAYAVWNKRHKQELLAESYRQVKRKDKTDLLALADEGLSEWEEAIRKS